MVKLTQTNKKVKNILRCYVSGMGIKETAATFHTSRNTVRKNVRFFQAEKVSSSFFPFPMDSCLRCLAVQNPDIGNLLLKESNWKLCFPDMYPVWHAKGRVSGNCSRSIMLNTLTVFSCPLSNGLSVSTSSTQRLSAMSSTMPQARCILFLPETGLKSLMRWLGKRRKPRYLFRSAVQSLYLLRSCMVTMRGRPDKGLWECHAVFWSNLFGWRYCKTL